MATKEELQKQLETIQAGLLNFTDVGEASFFKQTGQTKLTTTEVPRYTDVYNKELEPIKNINMAVGFNELTTDSDDRAFYVFDPARIAKQRAEQTIESVQQANLAATKQQEDIKAFLASENEAAKSAILNTYLSQFLNPKLERGQRNPFEWEAVDLNTPEGLAKWKNSTQRQTERLKYAANFGGRKDKRTYYYVKLNAEQAAAKRKLTEDIEKTRFMASPELQKAYAKTYADKLKAEIKTITDRERRQETQDQKIQREIDKLKAKLSKPQ